MDHDQHEDELAIIAALLERLIEDRRRGSLGPLEQYQALHPGVEELVRKVYYEVTGEASGAIRETDAGLSSSTVDPPPAAAQSRIGRFLIRGELGRGGQAIVYRAEDPVLHRTVALKVLSLGIGLTDQTLKRF